MSESAPLPVTIPSDLLAAMIDHCLREAPLECCGVLGGRDRVAVSMHPFTNVLASENRFEADPSQIIRAVVELRARGDAFVAIYHSHPKWQAVPSKTDLQRNGYGDLPQIIVGLLGDEPEVRAWRLDVDSYEEVPLSIVEPSGEDR